ncbi:hypothetical protein SAMN05421890_0806 [Ensifer adhaerens]|nr:hypothetical protein SAMN05421890_0806 [Ensifer adhaerens]
MQSSPESSFHAAPNLGLRPCFSLEANNRWFRIGYRVFQCIANKRRLETGPSANDARQVEAVILPHRHIDHSRIVPDGNLTVPALGRWSIQVQPV